ARARLWVVFPLLASPSCIQDDGTRFNPIEIVSPRIDDEAERKLGMEFDRELRKHVRVITDPVVAGFLNDLGQSIVRTIEPQPFIYHFRVVQANSLNAFAVPGGYVYFHSATLLAANSVDELAGVMGHEIAHVKAHHIARRENRPKIPDLVLLAAGMAAAIATNEPGFLVAGQALTGINIALQLRYTREFEAEADQLGGIFVSRAGYRPSGITRFFERLLEQEKELRDRVPPYLLSHPDVAERIESIRFAAKTLRPMRDPDPAIASGLREAQARLAYLVEDNRDRVPRDTPAPDRSKTDPLLAKADRLAERGEPDAALVVLAQAEAIEPADPRVLFQIGNLLGDAGRSADAIAAYQRTLRLDPSTALVFYRLGLAHKAAGNRHHAVYALEQAIARTGEGSDLGRRADWEVVKLTFPIIPEAGFADGLQGDGADTPAGHSRETFGDGDREIVWWARLGPRFVNTVDRIRVRWIDPTGAVVQEGPAVSLHRPYISSRVPWDAAAERPPGPWTVEARLDDDVVDRRTVQVIPSRGARISP
ncbi:MAG: M48 family metalloprotease, partial [Myxococcota bacterium]